MSASRKKKVGGVWNEMSAAVAILLIKFTFHSINQTQCDFTMRCVSPFSPFYQLNTGASFELKPVLNE
jgi:hypothetical protein